ncbi:MAG: selenide, water dikinase SelD [Chitinivibrionales bacterium]
MPFDLLTTVEYGGCSAKLNAQQLADALEGLPQIHDPNLLVDIQTHDDAGVYRLSDDTAIIQTTDFFPPICSDPYEFGQIAAANSLSDIYAMGGKVLTALNIVMFPQNRIPLDVLREILLGGTEKVREAEAVIVGGHTIDDYPPKYGMAVTGTVHPDRIISNAQACPGDLCILTKPIGTGILVAGQRIGESSPQHYRQALETMKLLNKDGAELMQRSAIRCATDVTGFGLMGHALKMAQASRVTITLHSNQIPLLAGAYELAELGCIPGAAFRNQEFVEKDTSFDDNVDYNLKMLMMDAQTSGGLLMTAAPKDASDILLRLRESVYPHSSIIGEVLPFSGKHVFVK